MEDLICLLATVRTLNTDSELLDLLINMPVYREVLKSVNDNTFKRKIKLESLEITFNFPNDTGVIQ